MLPPGSVAFKQALPQGSVTATFRESLEGVLTGREEVQLHFQPMVDLKRGTPTGFEALARFPIGMGPKPDLCFEAAGRLGKRLVLEDKVCRLTLQARERLPSNCFLSVNLGPEYLLSDECWTTLSEQAHLGACVFEITEETAITDYSAVRSRLRQIRQLGGLVAVDDAGGGYASLSHILEIKPDFIKLDRHFIQGCDQDGTKATMIEMIGAAASRLDAWIIAEGVEEPGELDKLISLGVPLAQGYLLARPAPGMYTVSAVHQVARKLISKKAGHAGEEQTLAGMLTPVRSFFHVPAADRIMQERNSPTVVVVVDRWKRPVKLVQRHPLLGLRELSDFMRVQVSSSAHEVLERALFREARTRFDPLVVIAEDGTLLGMIDIEGLASALLLSKLASS